MTMLQSMNVAGIIYVSGLLPLPREFLSIPTVCIDRKPVDGEPRRISLVESDNLEGGRLALQFLADRGCRRIACLSPAGHYSTHNIRFNAFREKASELGLEFSEDMHLTVPHVSYQDAYKGMSDFLEGGGRLDGLFGTTDWLAIGAIDAMKSQGLSVPQDVKVIGFDDISVASFREVPLSTIRQDTEDLAVSSVEILMEQIETSYQKPIHKIVPVQLIERQT